MFTASNTKCSSKVGLKNGLFLNIHKALYDTGFFLNVLVACHLFHFLLY